MAKCADWGMDSLITTFSLELPDSNQDLYPQVYLDEFHLFSNLPPELRLKIWKCMLPPPRHWYMGSTQSVFPPITSRINKESRRETMRHYLLVMFFKPASEGTVETGNGIKYRRQRTCLDFRKDIVCIPERYILKGSIPDDAQLKWMEEHKGFPKRVRILHIVHMRWEPKLEDRRREGLKELLKFFPNLKEIRLGRCLARRPDVLSVFDALRLIGVAAMRCKNVFNETLQAEHLKDSNFKIPIIKIHDPMLSRRTNRLGQF
jgi:hypothetical protein